jgi:hypothetical protein
VRGRGSHAGVWRRGFTRRHEEHEEEHEVEKEGDIKISLLSFVFLFVLFVSSCEIPPLFLCFS